MQTSADPKEIVDELLTHVLYSGEHFLGEGWQIAFQFGDVQASVAWTPTTQGVEVYAWKGGMGLWEKALYNTTPLEVRDALIELMNTYSKGEPMLNAPTQTATKYQIIVDQYASGSLAFVNRLSQVAEVSHLGDGVYQVTGVSLEIDDVISGHENSVLKVEAM